MAFLRSLTSAATASILPTAIAVATLSSSTPNPLLPSLPFPSLSSKPKRSFSSAFASLQPAPALHMDQKPPAQKDGVLPELLTEFMVDMTCDGCVSAVKNKLQTLDGIKGVDVDLSNQVVRVLGSLPVKTMVDALEQTGRKARLIGQGVPEESPTVEASKMEKQRQDKIQKHQGPSQKLEAEIAQGTKAKQTNLAEKASKRSKRQKVDRRPEADGPDSANGSLKNVQELSARRVKVMQGLGLIAPCGSPFRRNGFHKTAML